MLHLGECGEGDEGNLLFPAILFQALPAEDKVGDMGGRSVAVTVSGKRDKCSFLLEFPDSLRFADQAIGMPEFPVFPEGGDELTVLDLRVMTDNIFLRESQIPEFDQVFKVDIESVGDDHGSCPIRG